MYAARPVKLKPPGLSVKYMRSTFEPRALPEAIFIGEEPIVGPFCVHCGNPLSCHGPRRRCPNVTLHPVLPPPSCSCHGPRKS